MWRPHYSDDASPDVPSPVAHAHPSSAPTLARPPHDPHDPSLLRALSAALATESTMSLSTTASASNSALPDTVTSTSWIPAKQPLPPHHDHNHADVEKAAGARLDTAAQPMGVQEVRVDPVQHGVRARTEEKPAAAGDAPPDGGARAWLTVIGAWLVQFATFGYISAFGVYQDYYATTFLPAQTSSNISWIGSLQLCLMYLPGVFVGRAFDAGYFHHLEITGSIIYIFSIFMLSLARPGEYYQVFLAQAVGMGLGLGLTFIPSLSIVSHHFRARRALAVGVVISGASMGGIAFPIMLNRLIQDAGFANAVRASGAVAGGCLVLANVLMRTRLPPKARHSFGGRGPWAEWRGIVWDGPYLWSICGAFLTSLGVYVPLFYLQLFAADHGVTPRVTTYVLAILNAGSTLGRILPTFLADRLGVYNMLLPAILVCTAMIFAMFGATDVPGAVCVAVVFGFASGAYISLIPTLLVQLCRNMGELGVKMGLAYTIVASANLIGNPIAGALLGTDRGTGGPLEWWRAIVFTGCVAGAGLVCMAVSRMLFARRKGKQRV